VGRLVAWLTAAMALITVAIVILRYGFDTGAIALQESVIYLHAVAFMLGIAYTLKQDDHVRVDIVYSRLSPRGRDRVDLAGHVLFLLPVSATLAFYGFPYALASWRILEGSPEVGGIPALFLLKSLIPLMAIALLLQGLAESARIVRRLTGRRH
jgi:TRAP-type mannitol/chloroaromatic compound transport system permease small subunit